MLSFGTSSQLNSSTATVLSSASSLSSSPLSSSTSCRAAFHYGQKNSFAFPAVSQCPRLFVTVLFLCWMCQALVCSAMPVSHHNAAAWKYSMQSGRRYAKEHQKNSSFCAHCQDEMPQNDESPRSIPHGVTVPHSWTSPIQKRFYYLRADNDQYLQLHNYTISGTKVHKPDFGIVSFMSHTSYVVILSYHEKRYLCMNSKYALYLSDRLNSECYINESFLQPMGSQKTAYYFVKYQRDSELYLGINCDPLLGNETHVNMNAIRFIPQHVSEEEAENVRKKIEKSIPETYVARKCDKLPEKSQLFRMKRRKLRDRWCWNIDRLVSHRITYLEKCRARERDECDKSKNCVCDILWRMLLKPKRAKRKCLIEKLTKWVENQNRSSNNETIVEASKILMRSYSGIARRMRLLKSKQNNHGLQQKEKHVEVKTSKQNVPIKDTGQIHQSTSTEIPHRRRHENSRRKNQRRRRPIVKLNSILEKFRHELILSSDSGTSRGSLISNTAVSSTTKENQNSAVQKPKELSILSDEFKNVLNSLTNSTSRRRKSGHRKRRTRQNRRNKVFKTISADFHVNSYPQAENVAPG